MIHTLKINIVTTGNYITPPDDVIEYLPKQMSNAVDNTIYFTDKILITPAILQAASFKKEDYKNVFTTLALFKKLMEFIEDNYDILQMNNATTYITSEKFDKNTQSLIEKYSAEYNEEKKQPIQERKKEPKSEPEPKPKPEIKNNDEDDDDDDDDYEEEEDDEEDEDEDLLDANLDEPTKKFIKNMYNLKKTFIINKNINFLLSIFFPKQGVFNIEKYKAFINEYRYNNNYKINIFMDKIEYIIKVQLSLLNAGLSSGPNATADPTFVPNVKDFNKLACVEKSLELEEEIKDLFNYQLNLYSKPNQIMLNKYKTTDEYKKRIKLENKLQKKLMRERIKKMKNDRKLKEIEKLNRLKQQYDLSQLRNKLARAKAETKLNESKKGGSVSKRNAKSKRKTKRKTNSKKNIKHKRKTRKYKK